MTERGKQPGNIGELMTMFMCVLALTVVMLNYLQNVQLLQAKENVGQLARAYLLKMETVGYLEPAEQAPESGSRHTDRRGHFYPSWIPHPCLSDGSYFRTAYLPSLCT